MSAGAGSATAARAGGRVVAAASRRRVDGRRVESTCSVGEDPDSRVTEQLISRYERYIACARQPALRVVQRRILQQRTDAVVEVVERSGRSVRAEPLTALVCAVDGAVVAALVDDGDGPRTAARSTLIDVIDACAHPAPADHRTRADCNTRLNPVTVRLCANARAARLMLVNDGVFSRLTGGTHESGRCRRAAA